MKRIREMTAEETIERYRITLFPGQPGEADKLRVSEKITPEEREVLVSRKAEILAELKRRQAEEERRQAEEIAREKATIKAIESGEQKIVAEYYDGEYLSAYQVFGVAGELLASIGAAEYVEGWGWRVNDAIVKKFGTEFTLPQVKEYMEAFCKAKKAEEAKKETELQAKFEEARKSGKPALLQVNVTQCDGSVEECSGDIIERFALPDGSVKETRTHTY